MPRACCAARQPRAVVSFGGFAAGPGGIAARIAASRCWCTNRTAPPGMTNRVLAMFAKPRADRLPADLRRASETHGRQSGARADRAGRAAGAARFAHAGATAPAGAGRQPGRACLEQRAAAGGRGTAACRIARSSTSAAKKCATTRASAYADAGVVATVEPFIADMAAAYAHGPTWWSAVPVR
jgi:UDP-N-acetylglucosamine--N-acetylmuramyl-(pentapeptide) pyrophosphoryl-undecaprenol N-acetylglucosamine transferase